MSAKFTWSGGSPDGVSSGIRDGLVLGMATISVELQKDVRKYLSIPGTGRRYRVAKGRKRGRNLRAQGIHVASAPGRPPAVLNNHLRASWTVVRAPDQGRGTSTVTVPGVEGIAGFATIEDRKQMVAYFVGSNIVYARALEYGHRRVLPRPYIRPAVERLRPIVPELIAKAMKAHMRRIGGSR